MLFFFLPIHIHILSLWSIILSISDFCPWYGQWWQKRIGHVFFKKHQLAPVIMTGGTSFIFHFCSQLSCITLKTGVKGETSSFMAISLSTLREKSFRCFGVWLPGMPGKELGAKSSCRETAMRSRNKPVSNLVCKKLSRKQIGPGRICCPSETHWVNSQVAAHQPTCKDKAGWAV